MPYVYDFNQCLTPIKKMEVNPPGWRGPIVIEYATTQRTEFDPQLSVVWRIKGTTHTFSMYERNLNVISHGDYKKHFEEVLGNFRYEYLNWFKDEDFRNAQWKYDYKKQYGNLILPEKHTDKFSQDQKDNV